MFLDATVLRSFLQLSLSSISLTKKYKCEGHRLSTDLFCGAFLPIHTDTQMLSFMDKAQFPKTLESSGFIWISLLGMLFHVNQEIGRLSPVEKKKKHSKYV